MLCGLLPSNEKKVGGWINNRSLAKEDLPWVKTLAGQTSRPEFDPKKAFSKNIKARCNHVPWQPWHFYSDVRDGERRITQKGAGLASLEYTPEKREMLPQGGGKRAQTL